MKNKAANYFLLLLALVATSLHAQSGDPLDGYTNTLADFLPFSNAGFDGSANDAQVAINIGGSVLTNLDGSQSISGGGNLNIDVDTGSRGLFVGGDEFDFLTNSESLPTTFLGTNDLTSSARVYSGYYITTSVNFTVTQGATTSVVSANIPVLDVTTLGVEAGTNTTYSSPSNTGTLQLVGSTNTICITNGTFTLSGDEQVSYTNVANKGLLPSVSNLGIGFYLGTNGSGVSGPVGNNTNQIFNALLNLNPMTNGLLAGTNSMVAGYIVETNGIQLGLSTNTTNFAYTKLQPTGLSSSNSVPDWKPPTGQVVVNGVTNATGTIILDSGIGNAFLGLSDTNQWNHDSTNSITISLLNSGTNVGFSYNTQFDTNTTNDVPVQTNPPSPTVVKEYHNTNGDFYNSGRNVFDDYNVLYDAQDGYFGLLTNANGAAANLAFTPGLYSVPEPAIYFLMGLGALVILVVYRRRVSYRPGG